MSSSTSSASTKLKAGDRVAIVSLSGGLPEVLPLPYELGLKRLREDFSLLPVEYPTTRVLRSSVADRARDLHAAFADPSIKAVMASIGGSDQITLLPHLDADVFRAHPKPFFGYSDNTNFLAFLAEAGVPGYYGGSVMVHLGRPGGLHPLSSSSSRAALFMGGQYELTPAPRFTDFDGNWTDRSAFLTEVESFPGDGWVWHNPTRVVHGPTWGGCVEVLSWLLMANRCVPSSLEGAVLILETSEEMPGANDVYYTLRSIGERGLLRGVAGVMVARPKASNLALRATPSSREAYVAAQQKAVLRALTVYCPEAVVVMNVDFGHTDPQLIVPYGGTVHLDGPSRRIVVEY